MAAVRPQRARSGGEKPTRVGGVRFFQDRHGEWRWRLQTANHRIVCDSAEGYTRRSDAERGFKAMATLVRSLPPC